ncbi:MAG: hypothetical protein JWR38_4358 [Mucilaginibacter sp.]|nr:hypothetical protein [Mucilaginibacter sp.]
MIEVIYSNSNNRIDYSKKTFDSAYGDNTNKGEVIHKRKNCCKQKGCAS